MMSVLKRSTQLDLWGDPIGEPERSERGLIPLNFTGIMVRMVMIKGLPWWILSDLAKILSYRDAEHAKRLLRVKHWGTTLKGTPGIQPGMLIVNEAGLYRLMMRSDRPEAERFQDWITDDVLPEIRRTGTYDIRGKRVDREAKRLKINPETAVARCDQFANNRLTNRELADDGCCPNDFIAIYNAIYRGQFDADAPGLRQKLEQRYWETPLDRMGYLPLVANAHIKAIVFERIRALGPNVPMSAKIVVIEEIAREMARADLARLGPGYYIGLKDDPKRGKIIDVVHNPLAVA